MKKTDANIAIREITQIAKQTKPEDRRPFFFVLGAGISCPAIPLAREIVEHCRSKAKNDDVSDEPKPGATAIEQYGFWFSRAYPSLESRRKYLQSLILNKPITDANFRLAHMLHDGRIARVAVTTNFDDMLTRALRIFGQEFLICDHPATTFRIDPERRDIVQVVHAHGMHWSYDLANLGEEIEGVADHDSFESMGRLVGELMQHASPIMVGYSGWAGDVLTRQICSRLKSPNLPHPIYWFCYNDADEANVRSLLAGLSGSRHVRLVRGDPPSDTEKSRLGAREAIAEAATDSDVLDRTHTTGESILDARAAMDRLAQRMGMDSPRAVSQPVVFLYEQLKVCVPGDDGTPGTDPYVLSGTLAELRRVIAVVEAASKSPQARNDQRREAIEDLIRRQAWDEWEKVAGDTNPLEFDAIVQMANVPSLQSGSIPDELRSKIRSVEPLACRTEITKLDLSYTGVTDVSTLKVLTNLLTLLLNDTGVMDVSALQGLTNLKSLSLANTGVTDVVALKCLVKLDWLDLNNTCVTDVSALKDIVSIEFLDICRTSVTDVSALKVLFNLRWLDLSFTSVTDVSALRNLKKLTYLNLIGTKVTNAAVLERPGLTIVGP